MRPKTYAVRLVPIAWLLWLPAIASPEPDLVTDRPDQTESAVVVPPGRVQLETGWTFLRDDESGVRTDTEEAAGTLVRIGLAERVELRVGWAGYISQEVDFAGAMTEADGPGDTALGVKVHLREEQGRAPELALLAAVSIPSGSDEFSSDEVDPAFQFSASHGLTERLAIGYNAGMFWTSESGATLSSFLYTAALGIGVTDRLGAFVELFGEVPASASGRPANSFDGGLTYLLRHNIQVDLSGGVGLSSAADDWFVGLGISARFPR